MLIISLRAKIGIIIETYKVLQKNLLLYPSIWLHLLYIIFALTHFRISQAARIIESEKVIKFSDLLCFLLILLPVSAKSCIFAAEIGVKTCR